jgi:hypothetical protein
MTVRGLSIRHRVVDGWHIYDCEDMPELYVADRDPEVAKRDVEPSIDLLLRLNGKDIEDM